VEGIRESPLPEKQDELSEYYETVRRVSTNVEILLVYITGGPSQMAYAGSLTSAREYGGEENATLVRKDKRGRAAFLADIASPRQIALLPDR